MYTLKTSVELPIAHCLNDAYSGLCVGNISRDGKQKFNIAEIIPVLHGHNYVITVELSVPEGGLGATGMVIDFKKFKEVLHSVFDQYDHSMILTKQNPLVKIYEEAYAKIGVSLDQTRLFVWEGNPTAEYMAWRWRNEIQEKLQDKLRWTETFVAVTVEETARNSCRCDYLTQGIYK